MNKSFTLKLFALLVMSSLVTLSFNNAQATTYKPDFSADGNLTEWDGDEFMGVDQGIHHNFSYEEPDGTYDPGILFSFDGITLTNSDAGGGDLFIYFSSKEGNETGPDQGCNYTSTWNGVVHQLPFYARWAFSIEDSGYQQMQQCDMTAGWSNQPIGVDAYYGNAGNQVTEIRIKGGSYGLAHTEGANVTYLAYSTWQFQNNVYASWPTNNPANQAGAENFTHYFKVPIEDNYQTLMAPICPDECAIESEDDDPPAAPGGGNATEEESTLADTIGVVIQVAVVVIMVRVVMDMVRKLR